MSARKPTLVLVHGAFADHHAFDAIAPLLVQRGFAVVTPDLPGHGERAGEPAVTLDAYVAAIVAVVDQQPGPVVLVGHSMAGMVISQVGEARADKIARLVYIAAYLPTSGQSLQQLAETDRDSLVGQHMVFAPDYATVTITPARIADAICADVPPAIQQLIIASQRPEPLPPFQGKVTLTPGAFGTLPKAYLRTTLDRAVTPGLQDRMLAAYPGIAADSIATSHLPFVARPEETVTKLMALIER